MIRNNNQEVIRDLVKGQNKANRSRNRLLLIATITAALILTTVISVGVNYYQAIQKREVALSGAQFNGSLNGPEASQIKRLKANPKIKEVGLLSTAGYIIESEEETSDVRLLWGDTTYWEQQKKPALVSVTGTYPKKENELLLSEKAIEKLGLTDKVLKQNISLKVAQYDGFEGFKTFTVTGVYKDYSNKPEAFVSKTYHQKFGMPLEDLGSSRALVTLKTPFFFKKDLDKLETKLALKEQQWVGIDTEQAKLLIQALLALLLIGIVIITCSFLVIHNILYISICQDIHYYGLLKTIGTTRKQIKKIIHQQILRMALLGIGMGLLLGGILSSVVVTQVVKLLISTENPAVSTVQPLVLITTGLFTFATLYFSSNIAAAEANKISPVEATKYTGVKHSKEVLNSRNGSRIFLMAWRNVFRNRKQAILVLLSLFFGMTAFVTISSYVQNNDAKRILTALNVDDMTLTNKTTSATLGKQVFTKELLHELQSIPGVKKFHKVTVTPITIEEKDNPKLTSYIDTSLDLFWGMSEDAGRELMTEQPENFLGVLKGVDQETFKKAKKADQLSVNTQEFIKGQTSVVSIPHMLEEDFKKVSELTFQLDKKMHNLTIGNISSRTIFPTSPLNGFYPTLYVSEEYLQQLVGNEPYVDAVIIDYKEAYDQQTEQAVKKLLAENKEIDHESKLGRYQEMRLSESQIKGMGVILVVILILLATINFINTMTSSIYSRAKEFALLESIGMTKSQLRKMVVNEGLYYWFISGGLTIVVGLPIAWIIFRNTNAYQMSYLSPWSSLIIILFLSLLLCIGIPLLIYTIIRKKSLIERMRGY